LSVIGGPAIVEATAYAGFDFAILKSEHGPVCYREHT